MNNADKINLFRELLNWKDIMKHEDAESLSERNIYIEHGFEYYSFRGETNNCDYEDRCLINYASKWFDLINDNIVDNFNTCRSSEKYISDYISSYVIKDSLRISVDKSYYSRELSEIYISVYINKNNVEKFLKMIEENELLLNIENNETVKIKRKRI